jgi:hypothetical protein
MTTERAVKISIDLEDNDSSELLMGISELLKNISGTLATATVNIQANGMQNLAKAKEDVTKTGGAFSRFGEIANQATSKAGKVVSGFHNTLKETGAAVQDLLGSVTALAAGGAVAGLAWLDAARGELYRDQVFDAISANKKLKVSEEELRAALAATAEQGWTTKDKMTEAIQAAYLYGGKRVKGERGAELATAAEKIAFAKAPSLGGQTGADILRLAAMYPKELRPAMEMEFRKATADVADTAGYDRMLKTAKGRLKLLELAAKDIKIDVAADQQPWLVAMNNLAELKDVVGESLGEPMMKVTRIIADLALKIADIKGAPEFIALTGILLGIAGAAGLVVGVLAPLAGIIVPIAEAIGGMAGAAGGLGAVLTFITGPVGWLVVLGVILGATAYKMGILHAAWEKLIGLNDRFNNAFKTGGLGGAINLTMSLAGDAFKGIISSLLTSVGLQDSISKAIKTGVSIWQKITSFVERILAAIDNLWNKLMDLVPGARKEEARQKMERYVERINKSGLLGEEGGKNVVIEYDYKTGQFIKEGGSASRESEMTYIPLGRKALDAASEYERLPGFAEGIANAVAQGLSGIAGGIAAAVAEIPGAIADALKDLPQTVADALKGGIDVKVTQVVQALPAPGNVKNYEYDAEGKVTTPGPDYGKTAEDLQVEAGYALGSMAVGTDYVPRDGVAFLHKGERVIPASENAKGPVGGGPITLNVNIARVEKDVDVDRLMFRIRNELSNLQKREIGYYRG